MAQSFTLDQANSALVFVRPILEDIQNTWQEVRLIKVKANYTEETIHKKMESIERFIEELQQVGCILKDLDRGIVDFPSYFKDKAMFLCWRLGEEKIEHWHAINGNYESRQEIDEEFVHHNGLEKNSAIFTH